MSEIRATTITVMMSSSFDSLFLIFRNTLSLLTNKSIHKENGYKETVQRICIDVYET